MTIRDRRGLKDSAGEALSCANYPPRKLFGLHILVSTGVTFLVSLINYLLNMGIDAISGLDGIGTRAMLETVGVMLETVGSLAMPFWQFGIVCLALRLIRREEIGPGTLLFGFHRLGPVLRLQLLKGLLVVGVCVAGTYAGTIALSFTPLATGYYKFMMPLVENSTEAEIVAMMEDPAFMDQAMHAMLPLIIGALALTMGLLIPLLYRLRMTDFVLVNDPTAGARNAIKVSWRMTKGKGWSLFLLDLSFWWFYGLELLLSGIYLMDLYVPLPINPELYFWLCSGGYFLGQVVLYTLANGRVQTTYAAAYETLREAYEYPDPPTITSWQTPIVE